MSSSTLCVSTIFFHFGAALSGIGRQTRWLVNSRRVLVLGSIVDSCALFGVVDLRIEGLDLRLGRDRGKREGNGIYNEVSRVDPIGLWIEKMVVWIVGRNLLGFL